MRILLTILSIALLFSSCKKKDETRPFTHGKIHSNLYPFLFDVGSYWVYKDTATSILDSMFVTSIEKGVYSLSSAEFPGDEEYFKISYQGYPSNSVTFDCLMNTKIGTTTPFVYGGIKFICTKNIGFSYQNVTIESIIDSLNVEGQMYYDVIKINCQAPSYSYINATSYSYYVENIGVVKREFYLDTTLTGSSNLIRYNAVMKPYF